MLLLGAGFGAVGVAHAATTSLSAERTASSPAQARSNGTTPNGVQAADAVTGGGQGSRSPGSAHVTMPNGKSFDTQPGQSYSVPVGSVIVGPSGNVIHADQPGRWTNIPDQSEINVTTPENDPESKLPDEKEPVLAGLQDDSET